MTRALAIATGLTLVVVLTTLTIHLIRIGVIPFD
jgi:hypothetical protein